MIRYRRSNRVRDIVGVVFLALAALLLWIQTSSPGLAAGWAAEAPAAAEAVVEVDGAMATGVFMLESHG